MSEAEALKEALGPFLALAREVTEPGQDRDWLKDSQDWMVVFSFAGVSVTLGDLRKLAALAGSTVESAQQPAWRPFVHGETALEFGQRYAFADPATRRFSIQWAHAPAPGATWCISLGGLLASIPTPPKAEADHG